MPYDSLALAAGALSRAIGDVYSGLTEGLETTRRIEAGEEALTGQRLKNIAGLYELAEGQAKLAATQRTQARTDQALLELAAGTPFRDVVSRYPDVFPKAVPELLRPEFRPRSILDYVTYLRGVGRPVPPDLAAVAEQEARHRQAEIEERVARADYYGARSSYYGRRAEEPLRINVPGVGVYLIDPQTLREMRFYPEKPRTAGGGGLTPAQVSSAIVRSRQLAQQYSQRIMSDLLATGQLLDLSVKDQLDMRKWLTDRAFLENLVAVGVADESALRKLPPPPERLRAFLESTGGRTLGGWLSELPGRIGRWFGIGGEESPAPPTAAPPRDRLRLFEDEEEEDAD